MSDNNLPAKILIVDDDPSVAQSLEEQLARYNIKIEKSSNLETALYLFNTQRYEVVLVELEFAPLPGLALVQKWRQHEMFEKTCVGFVMMSGNKTLGKNEGLIKELGDLEVINKPFGTVQVLPFLSRALATKKRLVAYHEMKQKIDGYYSRTGDFNKAAEQVQKKLPELGPSGLNMLYDLYEKADRLQDALMIVSSLLDRDQNNISLINAKGRLLMRMGKFEEAREYLERSDKLAPQNIARLGEMAEMYLKLKQPDMSIEKFKQVLELNPDQPERKFEMFAKLFNHGFEGEAVKFGKECASPMEIVRHYNNRGVMASKDIRLEDALTEYRRALKFYPTFKENYRIYFNIALAQMQIKTRESYLEAEKNLKKCLELSPDFEKALKAQELIDKALKKKAG